MWQHGEYEKENTTYNTVIHKVTQLKGKNGQFRLEWPNTHQCTIQKNSFWDFMDGMKLSPKGKFIWLVEFYFLLGLFFPLDFFFGSSLFFLPSFFLFIFFIASLDTILFWELLCTPPTYLPPFLLLAHLHPSLCSPLFCACTPLHRQCLKFSETTI